MSVKAMSYVWEHSPYTGNALIVHLALADHCDDQGICWPSQKYLASKCKVSVRQIRRIIHQMVEDNYLFIETPAKAGMSNNRYRLLFGKPQDTGDLLVGKDVNEWPLAEDMAVTSGRGHGYGHHNHQLTTNNHQEKKGPPAEVKAMFEQLRRKHG